MAQEAPAVERPADGARWVNGVEALILLAAPVIAFFALHIAPMTQPHMIDPYLYSGYIDNGDELLRRFGVNTYFWSRIGFILPGRAFYLIGGALPGFYLYRYALALVAILPAYLLLRRMFGRAAGWVAVAVILTAPVILTAWGDDYPDAGAVSFLIAGIACLLMPAAGRRRIGWMAAAGLFAAMAVMAHFVAVLTVAAFGLAYLVVMTRRLRQRMLLELLGFAVGAAFAAVCLLAASEVALDHANILRSTIEAINRYRQPAEIAKFHSSTWQFLIYDVYLLVPPAVIAAWAVVALRSRTGAIRSAEWVLALGTAGAYLLHVFSQFAGQNWTLEYFLYTSMLWAGTSMLIAVTVARIGLLSRRGVWRWLPLVAVVAVPLLIRPFRDSVQLTFAAAIVVAVLIPAVSAIARIRRHVAVPGAVAMVGFLAATYVLTTGLPLNRPFFAGQVPYLTPDYGTTLFGDAGTKVDEYAVAAQMKDVVPRVQAYPGDMLLWWPNGASDAVNVAAAQYLWVDEALPSDYPSDGTALLSARRPRFLVLIGDGTSSFAAFTAALEQQGVQPRLWRDATLSHGSVRIAVRVLELGVWAPA
ncbi:MAG: glycosyltransferase family 39 protein [Candidatus Dormibacteraeota bacterium]|nr:glycosyltransferase family 39 protein [Candidatus Dormibacteraeota bacterium]